MVPSKTYSKMGIGVQELYWGADHSQDCEGMRKRDKERRKANKRCVDEKVTTVGLPRWSSGQDSELPIQRTWGLLPGQGTRSSMPQLRPSAAK